MKNISFKVLKNNKFVLTDDIKEKIIAEALKTKAGFQSLLISIKNAANPAKAKQECFKLIERIMPNTEVGQLCRERINLNLDKIPETQPSDERS